MTLSNLSCLLCCRQELGSLAALRDHLLFFAYRPMECPVCHICITGLQMFVRHLDDHLEPSPSSCTTIPSNISFVIPDETIDSLGVPTKSNLVQLDLISIQKELSSDSLNSENLNTLNNASSNVHLKTADKYMDIDNVVFKSYKNLDLSNNSDCFFRENRITNREKAGDSSLELLAMTSQSCSPSIEEMKHDSGMSSHESSKTSKMKSAASLRAYFCSICGEKIISQDLYFKHLQNHSIPSTSENDRLSNQLDKTASTVTSACSSQYGSTTPQLVINQGYFDDTADQVSHEQNGDNNLETELSSSDIMNSLEQPNNNLQLKGSITGFSNIEVNVLQKESDLDISAVDSGCLLPSNISGENQRSDNNFCEENYISHCTDVDIDSASTNVNNNSNYLPPPDNVLLNLDDKTLNDNIANLSENQIDMSANFTNPTNCSNDFDNNDIYFHKKFHHERKILYGEMKDFSSHGDDDTCDGRKIETKRGECYIPGRQSVWLSRLNDSISGKNYEENIELNPILDQCFENNSVQKGKKDNGIVSSEPSTAILISEYQQSNTNIIEPIYNSNNHPCDMNNASQDVYDVPNQEIFDDSVTDHGSNDFDNPDLVDFNNLQIDDNLLSEAEETLNQDESEVDVPEQYTNIQVTESKKVIKLKKNQHLNPQDTNRKCSLCLKVFVSISNYRRHMREKHSKDRNYICKECKKRFNSCRSLVNHMGMHRVSKSFQCNLCGHKCFTSAGIRTHKFEYHKVSNDKNVSNTYKCPDCDEMFNRKFNFERHKRRKHGNEIVSCNICDKSYNCEESLQEHLKSHNVNGSSSFNCKVCDATFKSKYSLKRHISHQHSQSENSSVFLISKENSENKFTSIRPSVSQQSLQMKRLNNEVRNINKSCDVINTSLNLRSEETKSSAGCSSNESTLITSDDKVQKRITSPENLIRSSQDLTGVENYDIDNVSGVQISESVSNDRKIASLSEATNEIGKLRNPPTHSQLKVKNANVCTTCHKIFSRPDSLKLHIRSIHSKNRPFSCEICDMKFSRKGSLETHKDKHKLTKSYSCEYCNKMFQFKGSLKHHSCRPP